MEPVKKSTYIIAAASFVILAVAIYFLFIFHKGPKKIESSDTIGEVKEVSEIDLSKRPYVTLTPTSNGAEIIISIESMSYFDKIEYELTYLADNPQVTGNKIQRGSTGTDVNPKDSKYKKSILLGTASRGASSPDKGVTDGKLALHLFKGDTEYLSETDWDLEEIGMSAAKVENKVGTFTIETPSFGKNYWVIVADTVGIPSSDEFKTEDVITPSFGVFSVAPKFPKKADLAITLDDKTQTPQLYSFHSEGGFEKLESTYDSSAKTLSATVNSFATFVVVNSK